MKHLWYLLVVVFLLQGCGTTHHFVNLEYGNAASGYSLAIMPLPPVSFTHYSGSLYRQFGKVDPSSAAAGLIAKDIERSAKLFPHCSRISFVDSYDGLETEKMLMPYKKGKKIGFIAPAADAVLITGDSQPDFILLINDISIGTVGGGTSKVLTCNATYCVWDNVNQGIFAYGIVDCFADGLYGEISQNTWTTLLNRLTCKLSYAFYHAQTK